MRTTIRLDEHLLAEAKRRARESNRTLTDLIEESLRQTLARRAEPATREGVVLPIYGRGGLLPGSTSTATPLCWTSWTSALDPSGRQRPRLRASR